MTCCTWRMRPVLAPSARSRRFLATTTRPSLCLRGGRRALVISTLYWKRSRRRDSVTLPSLLLRVLPHANSSNHRSRSSRAVVTWCATLPLEAVVVVNSRQAYRAQGSGRYSRFLESRLGSDEGTFSSAARRSCGVRGVILST